MIDQIFAVYDEKAEAFMPPFMLPKIAMATRTFADSVNNPESGLNKHPEDYQLFHLGEFDNSNAQYSLLSSPKPLGNGLMFKAQQELFPTEEMTNAEVGNDTQLSGHATG